MRTNNKKPENEPCKCKRVALWVGIMDESAKQFFRECGRRGGQAKGLSKRRSREHYKRIARLSANARAAKREAEQKKNAENDNERN